MDKRDVAMTRKLNLAIADSDHITLVAAYNTWQKVRLNWNAQKKFCEDNFISGRTMSTKTIFDHFIRLTSLSTNDGHTQTTRRAIK